MPHIRISLVIDIKADATDIQAAALTTPMYADGVSEVSAPEDITQDLVTSGHILSVGVQNYLADRINHGSVELADVQVQSLEE